MHHPQLKPQIAVASPNTLACLGLVGIIHRVMPMAEVRIYGSLAEMANAYTEAEPFHYFIASRILMEDAAYFLKRRQKTIVMVHGDDYGHIPQGFHTLNVCQSEEQLFASFMRLAEMAHGLHGRHPEVISKLCPDNASPLTSRETEVLRLIVAGKINKEIASQLGVSLTTIITHRKNLTEKLGIKSISGLTIYAVMHGLVKAEEV